MKLQIASDIHREFGHSPEVPDIGADVLVLAGDIGYADDVTVEWLRDDLAGRYEAILYVPGTTSTTVGICTRPTATWKRWPCTASTSG